MKRRKPANRSIPLAEVLCHRGRKLWTKRIFIAVLLIGVVSIDRAGCLLAPNERRQYDGQWMQVVKIVDGDTIDVRASDGGEPTRVRLWGIDTPETAKRFGGQSSEPFADAATELTRRLCAGQTVRLHLESHRLRGTFGRLLAHVELRDGRILNEELLLAGLARYEPRWAHSKLQRYELLEQQARHDHVGMWSQSK